MDKQDIHYEHRCPHQILSILLPIVVKCLSLSFTEVDTNGFSYIPPYHPFVIVSDGININTLQQQSLINLLFFHIRNHLNNYSFKCDFVDLLMNHTTSPMTNIVAHNTVIATIYESIKTYLIIECTACLLCENDYDDDSVEWSDSIRCFLRVYVPISKQQNAFDHNMKQFLSTILRKRDWNYLINLLQSNFLRTIHNEWSTKISELLSNIQKLRRNEERLHVYDQLEFTLSTNAPSCSAFSKLHQPYTNISKIFDECANNKSESDNWTPLFTWCLEQLSLEDEPLFPNEIKMMLFLKIYYDYYCHENILSLSNLVESLQSVQQLELIEEELRVFKAILMPETYMIGYNDHEEETNALN
ncbi:unnamed protein product, partial [Didymodactylos carnosus]